MRLPDILFYAEILSIPLSIAAWMMAPDITGAPYESISDPALVKALAQAHAERWGLFVGLWAPTLLILSQAISQRRKF